MERREKCICVEQIPDGMTRFFTYLRMYGRYLHGKGKQPPYFTKRRANTCSSISGLFLALPCFLV